MPQIPIQPKVISTDVPTAGTNPLQSAGQTGNAFEHAGNSLMDVGFSLVQKMKEAEAVSASSNAHAQDVLDSQVKFNDLKSASPDGYYRDEERNPIYNPDGSKRTITEEYRDWANDRFKATQLTMPSQLAQQAYQGKALSFYTDQIRQMSNTEDGLNHDFNIVSDDMNLQKAADRLSSIPDVRMMYDQSNNIRSTLADKTKTGTYSFSESEQRGQQADQILSDITIRNGITKIKSNASQGVRTQQIQYWKNVLDGTDKDSIARKLAGLSTASDMLKPEQKSALLERLENVKKLAQDLDTVSLHSQFKNTVAGLNMGENVPLGGMNQAIDQAVASGHIKPDVASDMKAQLVGAQSVQQMNTSDFALAPASQQKAMIESQAARVRATAGGKEGGSIAGAAAESAFRKQAAMAAQRSQAAKESDFPAYVQSQDTDVHQVMSKLNFSDPTSIKGMGPDIQMAIQKTKLYYDHNFPGNDDYSRILSDDQADQLAGSLKNAQVSPEQTAQAISTLRKEFGSYYPEMIDDLILDKKLPESFRIAGSFASDTTTQNIMSALKSAPSTDKNFRSLLDASGKSEHSFNVEAGSQLSKWTTTMLNERPGDPNNSRMVQDYQDLVKKRAMQIYTTNGGGNVADAVKASVDEILQKNFTVTDSSPGWFTGKKSYTFRIPNQTAEQKLGDSEKNQIAAYVKENTSGPSLKTAGVLSPPNSAPTFYDDIAKTGYFALAQNNQGYNFFYTDPASNRTVPARVSNGKGGLTPLFVPISTMIQPTGKVAPSRRTFDPGGGH